MPINVADVVNLSVPQVVGGGGSLVVLGIVTAYLIKILPVLNEERRKWRTGSIDEWKGLVEQLGAKVLALETKMADQEEKQSRKYAIQQELYFKCQEDAVKTKAELIAVKADLARMEVQSSFNSAPLILVCAEIHFTLKGEIVSATDGVLPLVGWNPNDLVGEDIEVIIPHESRKRFRENIDSLVIKEGETESSTFFCDYVLKKNHKDKINALWAISKVSKPSGEVIIQVVFVPRKGG